MKAGAKKAKRAELSTWELSTWVAPTLKKRISRARWAVRFARTEGTEDPDVIEALDAAEQELFWMSRMDDAELEALVPEDDDLRIIEWANAGAEMEERGKLRAVGKEPA